MRNPWLDIALADYEGHMGLPEVAQAGLLADVFGVLLADHAPRSVAVLGCAGGNGFDRISPAVTERVVGVDINPTFIDATHNRFQGRFRVLELVVGDLQADDLAIEPIDCVYAGLVFEYLDLHAAWRRIRSLLRPAGVVGTVVQLPTYGLDAVTPSAYSSVQLLAPSMRLVSPEDLRDSVRGHGAEELRSYSVVSRAGKQFRVQVFRSDAMTDATEIAAQRRND
jgi:SAM-dependent methyltransferase